MAVKFEAVGRGEIIMVTQNKGKYTSQSVTFAHCSSTCNFREFSPDTLDRSVMEEHSAEQSTTISRLGLDCQEQFTELVKTLREADTFHDELSSLSVSEELGRFRTWANNIGAVTSGRASLDYRVKNVEYLRLNIRSLLEDLKASLMDGYTSSCLALTL